MIPICYYVNKRIILQLINKSLVFNLILLLIKLNTETTNTKQHLR